MPIINKGILDIATVSLRQTGNDWPTAQVTTTSDVVEVSSNLYFTNARVISSLTQSNVYVQNLIANDTLFANALILQNINVTSNIITGTVSSGTTTSNIIVADSVTSNTWNRLYSSNVVENTNLFFTNARAVVAITSLLTTANVIETSANLYFTNTRAVSALIAGQNIIIESNGRISANVTSSIANLQSQISNLSTDQIGEGSVNLYYTNSRVVTAFTAGDNIIIEANGRISANVGLSIANLQSQISGLTTDQIGEGNTNKYFTNARAVIAVTPLLTTSNVAEGSNLYFTAARVNATVQPFLTTANVVETSSNLYFTNSRVLVGITTGTVVGNITATGIVTANIVSANTLAIGSGAGGTLSGIANISVTNTVTTNILSANTISIGSGVGGTIAGIANIIATNTITANIIRANIIILQNINVTSNIITGTVSSGTTTSNIIVADSVTSNTWNRLYTANVIETSGNLYFTNARVVSALIAGQNIVIEANGRISANATTAATLNLTTADVRETSNLYFTNARVLVGITTGTVVGNIAATGTITTNILSANTLAIGSGAGGTLSGIANLIVTNTVTANIISANTLSIGTGVGGTIAGFANITATDTITANIIRANIIILQNINVTSNIITGTVSSGASASNTIVADSVTSNTWNRLYTSNVIETSGNLYFTNARVLVGITTGTVVGNIAATGTVTANSLVANTLAIGSGAGGTITGIANITVTNTVTANILSANTISIGSGVGGTIAGIANIIATGTITTNILSANTISIGTGVGGTIAGATLISAETVSANIIRANTIILQNINVTSNIITGTVSSGTATSNTIVADSVTSNTWNRLYTANVIETSGNLYFTNARVVSALIAGQNITIEANGRISSVANSTATVVAVLPYLTTSNVAEGSNLYFTNTRVLVGITTGTVVGNITATGTVTANSLVANILSIGSGVGGTITGIANITVTNTVTTNILSANTISIGTGTGGTISGFANVIATGTITTNILSANTLSIGTGVGGTIAGANLISAETITANIIRANTIILQNINVTSNILTGTVSSGTTTSNTILTDSITSNTWNRLYTSNVIENTNLFFTNARVLVGITTGTVVGNITATGIITANIISANVGIFGSGSGGSLLGANIISAETISANLLLTNVLIANAAILGSGVGGSLTGANLLSTITIQANSWLGLYTANVIESPTNLFFTNARVFSAIAGGSSSLYVGNTTASTSKTTGALRVAGGVGINNDLTVGNSIVVDGGAYGNVTTTQFASVFGAATGPNPYSIMQVRSSDNVSGIGMQAFPGSGTLYGNAVINFALATVRDRDVPSSLLTKANIDSTGLTVFGNVNASTVQATNWNGLYTANVVETSGNLYFTNARVIAGLVNSNVQVENLFANSTIYANTIVLQNINVTSNIISGSVSTSTTTSNIILADIITANTWNRLYTANVIETSGNLYFTNTRVVSALIAGENVTIEANGRISASSILPISVINDSYRFISTGNTTYNIGTSVNDPKNVLVIVEGLIQLPVVDYTVSSTSLIFTEPPTNGTNVEVRFFGTDTINSGRALTSDISAFIGNGSSVNYTLSSTPPNKNFVSIIIDGVYQQSDSYTLSNKIITFSEAPAIGANIDIRVIGGIAGSSYNTRTFTGNGTSNTFALSEGFNKDTVLVFENGVAQMPIIDYDIVNDSLVFTTPPAANIVVQVRELGIPSLSVANVLASVRGLDQTVGNLVPTVGVSKNLGSSASPFNQLYLSSNVVLSGAGTTLYITGGGTTTQVATAASVSAKAFGLSLIFGG